MEKDEAKEGTYRNKGTERKGIQKGEKRSEKTKDEKNVLLQKH